MQWMLRMPFMPLMTLAYALGPDLCDRVHFGLEIWDLIKGEVTARKRYSGSGAADRGRCYVQ